MNYFSAPVLPFNSSIKQALSLQTITYVLMLLFAMSIPLSTTATDVITVMILLIWLIDKAPVARWQSYFSYELTKPILCLIVISLIAMFYSIGTWKSAVSSCHHILRLSYIPIFAYYIHQKQNMKQLILIAFVAALVFTIFCSMLKVYAHIPIGQRTYGNDVFKNHIVISYFMSISIFISSIWFIEYKQYRWACILVVALALYYLIFLNTGRIGYVMLYLCLSVFAWHRYKLKGTLAIILLLSILMLFAFQFSETFATRFKDFYSELMLYFQGHATESIGHRLAFAHNSLSLFWERPFFGFGSGGFSKAYALYFEGTGNKLTSNPHNQYLKIVVELGLVGLLSFSWLFYRQWRLTQQLTGTTLIVAQGIFLSFFMGCLFNSWIDNFSECYFYCLMTAYFLPCASRAQKLRAH